MKHVGTNLLKMELGEKSYQSRLFYKYMDIIIKFFNSSFFASIMTLLTGIIVIQVYLNQKNDLKIEAATIILLEIKNAEDSISKIKEDKNTFHYGDSILPVNSWSKYSYLFVRELNKDELNSLNDFYNKCSIIESTLRILDEQQVISLQEKQKAIYPELLNLAKKYSTYSSEENLREGSKYKDEEKAILETYFRDPINSYPLDPVKKIRNLTENIRFITSTSVDQELERIAGI